MKLVRDDVRRTYRITQTIGSRFYQYYVGRLVNGPERAGHQFYTTDHVLPFGYWLDRDQWVPVVHVHRELPELDREDPFADAGVLRRFAPYAQGCNGCHTTFALGDMFPREPLRLARHAPWQLHWNLGDYVEGNRSEFFSGERTAESISEEELQELGRMLSRMDAREFGVTLGISCEACHLGSRRHAADPKQLPEFAPKSPHLLAETPGEGLESGRTHANLNWACGRCHAGSRSEFAAGMGTWNSIEYTDATRGGCYSQLKCIDCHDPHQAIGPRWTRTRAQDEAVCLKCHQEFVSEDARRRHSHHLPGSTGDGCLECHMPRINEGLQDVVRTHTIFSPNHRGMLESNHPNACNLCHLDRSARWTSERMVEWYGHEPAELVEVEQTVASWVLLVLQGDPVQRAVATWHAGWQPARDASGTDWLVPHLAEQLDDVYSVNRWLAWQALKSDPDRHKLEVDFVGPRPGREVVWMRLRREWASGSGGLDPDLARRTVLVPGEGLDRKRTEKLLLERDYRDVTVPE